MATELHGPGKRERLTPPRKTCGYRIDPSMPLHQLAADRYQSGRDLKVIITSKDAETGTGKTTLAFWLCDQWQQMLRGDLWEAEKHATLDIYEYLDKYRSLQQGSVLLLDEAEELDSRRAMANKNVDFSHYWMKMRVRQVMTVLTLPSTTALDSRLEELADVWIEVQRRGKALVHDIRVNSYNKSVQTWQVHDIEWPDVSSHPEMKRLDEMKDENIDDGIHSDKEEDEADDNPDPKEVERESQRETAQRLRNQGLPIESQDPDQPDIVTAIGMSQGWVSKNTTKEDSA